MTTILESSYAWFVAAQQSQAVVIDPVLDFNAATNELSTKSADKILALVKEKEYRLTYLFETHVHADHLTASHYLKQQIGRYC